MATAEEVNNMLALAAESSGVAHQTFSLTAMDTENMAPVDLEELKPIIMTMANMASGSDPETQVEVTTVTTQPDVETQAETVLSTHLTQKQQDREVYVDRDSGVTYEIVRGGTRRGGDKLIDSLGFTYNLKQSKSLKNKTYWWCAVRNSQLRCPAAVIQKNGMFMRGKRKHEHQVGQSTPNPVSKTTRRAPRRLSPGMTRAFANDLKKMVSSKDYRLIKGGSKAGMDLLKDVHGYTYTLKKAAVDGWKKSWRCSVRNKFLRCAAGVLQFGNQFLPGNCDHSHMPGCSRPLGEKDVAPSLRRERDEDEEEDEEDEDEEEEGEVVENKDYYRGYSHSPSRYTVTQKHKILAKQKKRRSHPTFLGPSCTINLTKCEDGDCNCKLVHCPFCDKHHFKPAKAGRVQDHLEMTHFAHGVQFDDLMIVKCFQDCSLERNFGHYHCVFCFQQILKRNAYARHMLRHLRQMAIPDRLLVLPDSKFPDVINAYGYEIPICRKAICQPSQQKHYHCPQCQTICQERSLTVNHLWRCLQRKENADTGQLSDDPEEEMLNTIDESQLILHSSHVKAFKDLPLNKCSRPGCCGQKYHCLLCPTSVFRPTYRQHLVAHYVAHWKQRVTYKAYNVLKCFQCCDGIDRSTCKTRYHFHCPICAKIILTKGSFQDHLNSCHMLKFGENLLNQDISTLDESTQEDLFTAEETAPLLDSVAVMEEKLTSQAMANEITSHLDKIDRKKRRSQPSTSKHVLSDRKLQLEAAELRLEMRKAMATGRKKDKLDLSMLKNTEVFELSSAVVCEKFVQVLRARAILMPVLEKVARLTGSRVGQAADGNKYLLSGKVEQLLSAQELLKELVQTVKDKEGRRPGGRRGRPIKTEVISDEEEEEDDDEEEEESSPVSKAKHAVALRSKKKPTHTPTKKAMVKEVMEQKRGRGRPRKSDGTDSFPYSEIKEIIAASKKTDGEEKRGRGRPPKKKVESNIKTKRAAVAAKAEQKNKPETLTSPTTPGRYSTRGIKRNYVEMNAGIVREIKTEPVSEPELEPESEENEEFYSDDEDADYDESEEIKRRKLEIEESEAKKSNKRTTNKQENAKEVQETPELDNDSSRPDKELDVSVEEVVDDEEDKNFISDEDDFDDDDDDFEELMDEEDDDVEEIEVGQSQNEEESERTAVDNKITDSTVKSLKTSNVATSVPQVFKVGIRAGNFGKKKTSANKDALTGAQLDDEEEREKNEVKRKESLKCSLCDDNTAEKFSDLTQHLKKFHHVYDPPRCDVCEMDFDTTNTLKFHIDKRHGPRNKPTVLACTFENCGKVFSTQNGLTGHMNKVHLGLEIDTPKQKRYQCSKCDFTSNSIEDFYEHKKVSHGDMIQCDLCSKIFLNYQSLKTHKELKHSGLSPVKCEICDKQFSHTKYLQKHTQLHLSSGFACHICDKTLTNKTSLKAHLDTHKPEWERTYKYKCSYCEKQFSTKSNYDDHLNKHTGAKPYKCDICSRAFGFRSMLLKHKTFVHSNDRPFKCGFCMKGFKFMNLLQNHITTHTNKSKHVCNNCNKSFSTASTLKFHQRKCKGVKVQYAQLGQRLGPNTYMVITDPTTVANPQMTQQTQFVTVDGNQLTTLETVQAALETQQQSTQANLDYTPMMQEETVGSQLQLSRIEGLQGTTQDKMVPQESLLTGNQQQAASEETVDVATAADPGQQVEVFACSECSATFGSYAEAEAHVLTAHPGPQPTLPADTMEVMVEETLHS